MDPASAIGVASAVLTFAQVLGKAASELWSTYTSADGLSTQLVLLKTIADQSQSLFDDIQRQSARNLSRTPSKNEQAIFELTADCAIINAEIHSLIGSLSATPGSLLSSTIVVTKGLLKRRGAKIKTLERKLERLQDQIQLRLLGLLRDDASFIRRDISVSQESSDAHAETASAQIEQLREAIVETIDQVRSQSATESVSGTALRDHLDAFALMQRQEASKRRIIASLSFPNMNERRQNVHSKSVQTFNWLFDGEHAGRVISFQEWLQSADGNRIFWISGKAGSGKSTLMKWISEEHRTQILLNKWSGGRRLVVGSYFFWSAGTSLQKSQEGLLRCLLVDILRQCPDALASNTEMDGITNGFDMLVDDHWSLSSLRKVFRSITTSVIPTHMFCFFIDGMDEYLGHAQDLVDVLIELADLPNVKLCVSSRPWPVFKLAFRSSIAFRLILHEHTHDDIEKYVRERLTSDQVLQPLRYDVQNYDELAQLITSKANGVFLWVYLVCRSIKHAAPNGDTLDELRKRVDNFPPELDDYFLQMLERIPSEYHTSSAQLLLMCLASNRVPVIALKFAFEPEGTATVSSLVEASQESLREISEETSNRIRSRCVDLLDVCEESHLNWITRMKAQFLHRTVYDFLSEHAILEILRARAGRDFDPSFALCKGYYGQLRRFPFDNSSKDSTGYLANNLEKNIRSIFSAAYQSEKHQTAPANVAHGPSAEQTRTSSEYMRFHQGDGAQQRKSRLQSMVEKSKKQSRGSQTPAGLKSLLETATSGKSTQIQRHAYFTILDALEKLRLLTIAKWIKVSLRNELTDFNSLTDDRTPVCFCEGIRWGLIDYVSYRLSMDRSLANYQETGIPPLSVALIQRYSALGISATASTRHVSPPLTQMLLSHGADPQVKVNGVPLWHFYLKQLAVEFRSQQHWTDDQRHRNAEVLRQLVEAGVDLDACSLSTIKHDSVYGNPIGETVESTKEFLARFLLPDDFRTLSEAWQSQKSLRFWKWTGWI